MPAGSLRENKLRLTIVAALLCALSAPAIASDWVEDGVSEFHLPRAREEATPPPVSPEEEASPLEMTPPKKTSGGNRSRSTDNNNPDFVPPDDAVVKNVTDQGGVELGPDGRPRGTRPPLEAGISTWRQKQGDDGNPPGANQRAARLLMQAPLLATPKTISADPKAFQSWLSETHPGLIQHATREQIIEIKGEWDDSGHALRTFGLPCTKVSAKKFSEVNLEKVKIVVVNCEGHLTNDALMSLRRYVAMGGSLLTTDWALENVVEKAFPGIVEWNEGYYTDGSANQIVDAVIVGEDRNLVQGTTPVGHWQLVKKSQIVRIVKPENVEVLARSRMMREDPTGLGILAVTFRYGAGHVLHLVGHFDNNSELAFNTALPDPAPGLGVSLRQALAANFVALALEQQEPGNHSANQ